MNEAEPGAGRYASDYLHRDYEYAENIQMLSSREDLSSEARQWLMAGTAKQL